MTNITNKDGVLTATDGGTGTIVWQMKVPYQFIGGTLAAAGDGYAFEIGFLDPKDWRKTVYTPLATLAEFDGKFKGRTADGERVLAQMHLDGQSFAERRQNQERHPDGAAGHAVHDRGKQQFHVLGAHGRQERRKRRQDI